MPETTDESVKPKYSKQANKGLIVMYGCILLFPLFTNICPMIARNLVSGPQDDGMNFFGIVIAVEFILFFGMIKGILMFYRGRGEVQRNLLYEGVHTILVVALAAGFIYSAIALYRACGGDPSKILPYEP